MCCVMGLRGVPFAERGAGEEEPGERTRSAQDILTDEGFEAAGRTVLGVEGTTSSEREEIVVVGDRGVRSGEEWEDGAVDMVVVVGVPGRGIGAIGTTAGVGRTGGIGLLLAAIVGGGVSTARGGGEVDTSAAVADVTVDGAFEDEG